MTVSPIIDLQQIDVTFKSPEKTVKAVQQVSLTVAPGDIYGVVGYSGAGKSTLVRVINLLQRPTSGRVTVNGQDMLALKGPELRKARQKIGMIFQHFNLMAARTIAENVAFPLRKTALSKQQRQAKVQELLALVELADKADAYPSQLSGGQKQRVGIARALASDPEILISDEATSALDPKTTTSILALLKSLNEQLGLTVVLITHEMDAVKQICNKVAVMDEGEIIERGSLLQIFGEPKTTLTQDFVNTSTQIETALQRVVQQPVVKNLDASDLLVRLSYVGKTTDEPLISELFKRFQVTANILFGNIEILQATPLGTMIIVLSGEATQLQAALAFLATAEVSVKVLKAGQNYQALREVKK